MMFKAGECIMKTFINFSIFVCLCSVVFFFLTMVGYSKENATEKAPGEFTQIPVEGAVPEGMVLIPAGEFQMGSNDEGTTDDEQPPHTRFDNFARESCCPNEDHGFDELPRHTVYVDAFYMDTHEVTNAQYKKFVEANPQWQKDRISAKYHDGKYLMDWNGNNYPSGKGNHPVAYVSWYAAMAYSKWAGKRLPTEAEWEYAARGGLGGKAYPWGDRFDHTKAHHNARVGGTIAVGNYPANGYGLYDMTGNVSEWCLDNYDSDFYAKSPYRNPISGVAIDVRLNTYREVEWFYQPVVRGGSYITAVRHARVAFRGYGTPPLTNFHIGFRCVRDSVTP